MSTFLRLCWRAPLTTIWSCPTPSAPTAELNSRDLPAQLQYFVPQIGCFLEIQILRGPLHLRFEVLDLAQHVLAWPGQNGRRLLRRARPDVVRGPLLGDGADAFHDVADRSLDRDGRDAGLVVVRGLLLAPG